MNKPMNLIRPLLVLSIGVLPSLVSATDRPSAAGLADMGLQTSWVGQAVMDVRRDTVAFVRNDEENVYVQSSGGVLTVLHAENGRQRWFAQVGRSTEPSMHAVSNDDTVVVIAGPVAYGFNKFDGTPLFRFRLPHYPTAAPAVDENAFYVPLTGGALYAYSLKVLEYRYRYGSLPDTVAKSHIWRFICGENIIYPPAIGETGVAFVTEAGSLHALSTTGFNLGQSRFQLLLNEPASAPLAIDRNETSHSVLMATKDYQIFSIDLESGRREWVYPHGRLMAQAPVQDGTEVYIVSEDGTLTKFSRDSQSPSWGRPVEVAQYSAPLYLGLSLHAVEIDPDTQDAFKLAAPDALQIRNVVRGGAAATAGLRAGDRLVSIDGYPVATVEDAQQILSEMPPGVNRNIELIRVSIGAEMAGVQLPSPVNIGDDTVTHSGVKLTNVALQSPAAAAYLQSGDIVVSVDDNPVQSPDDLNQMLTAVAPGTVALKVLRGSQSAQVDLNLAYVSDVFGRTDAASALRLQRLQVRIPQVEWDVNGVASISAVGRFGVYGVDVSNRLLAFDRASSQFVGRTPVSSYTVRHSNSYTDLLYLTSESGEVLCLKEIGPTVIVPDLGPDSREAKVTAVEVQRGDAVDASGTTLCQLELADGQTIDVYVEVKGLVNRVLVQEGDTVVVGQPLFRVKEDRFAAYYRRPDKRPIDLQAAPDDES